MVDLKDILKLPVADRISLIEKIWASIDPKDISITAEHKKELDRRIQRYKKGETALYSWEDVKAQLKK